MNLKKLYLNSVFKTFTQKCPCFEINNDENGDCM